MRCLSLSFCRFAKAAQGRTFTLCGVPEYLAPEVVGGTGHDESVDLWALGVLVYHLITGEGLGFVLGSYVCRALQACLVVSGFVVVRMCSAPEVVGGTGHDESLDLWALGVLVYHLITGEVLGFMRCARFLGV
jgi:serine/threonine protein kinase